MDTQPSLLRHAEPPPQPSGGTPPTAVRTVGVDQELLLVDPLTGRVSPVASAALATDTATGAPASTSSAADGVAVLDRFRCWLPILTARWGEGP